MNTTMYNRSGYQAQVTQLPTGTLALLTPCCQMLALRQDGRMENMAVCHCGEVYGLAMLDRFPNIEALHRSGWSETPPVLEPAKAPKPVAQSDDEWDEFM